MSPGGWFQEEGCLGVAVPLQKQEVVELENLFDPAHCRESYRLRRISEVF
jgi:hypothetical protein